MEKCACRVLFEKWAATKDAAWWETFLNPWKSVGGLLSSSPWDRARMANRLVGRVQRPLHRFLGIRTKARRRRPKTIVVPGPGE